MNLPPALSDLLSLTDQHLTESNSYHHSATCFRMHFVLDQLPQHLPGRYSGICRIPGTDLWCCHSSATLTQFEKWCRISGVTPVVQYNLTAQQMLTKADRSIKIPADSPLADLLDQILSNSKQVSKRIAVPLTPELITNYINQTGERRVTYLARHFGCSTTNIIYWLDKLNLRNPDRRSKSHTSHTG